VTGVYPALDSDIRTPINCRLLVNYEIIFSLVLNWKQLIYSSAVAFRLLHVTPVKIMLLLKNKKYWCLKLKK